MSSFEKSGQLANERYVADRESYSINIVKADMTETFPFDNDEFDIIFHAISNCYVEDIYHIWNECYRTLKNSGILIAGMGNGINYLFDDIQKSPLVVADKLPYNPLRNHEQYKKINFEYDAIQFSHSLEEQIDTDELNINEVVETIAKKSNIKLEEDNDMEIIRKIKRTIIQIKHIRLFV